MGLKDLGRKTPGAQRLEGLRSVGEVASIGLSFVLAIVIGTAVGWWLDQKFGWKPYGFFGGFVLGLVAGVRNVYQVTRHYWTGTNK